MGRGASEASRTGLWNELDPIELASVLSALVFEARRPDDARSPKMPGGRIRDSLRDLVHLWSDLDELERSHRLDFLREPDLGFAWAAYRWAEGDDLDEVIGQIDLARSEERSVGEEWVSTVRTRRSPHT